CGPEPVAPPPDAAAAHPGAAEPAPPITQSGNVRRIQRIDEVALAGPRIDARPGDYVLESGNAIAVVSTERGRVVDFGPRGGRARISGRGGGRNDLYSTEPSVFGGLKKLQTEIEAVEPVGEGGRVVRVRRRVLDEPLALYTFVYFAGETLKIESVATNTAKRD